MTSPKDRVEHLATFSIVARSTDGMLGVAVSSRVLAVGARCPTVAEGSFALSSQAYANPYLAEDVRSHVSEGKDLASALRATLDADDAREWRQVAAIPAVGDPVAFTGSNCDPNAGDIVGRDCAAAGNLLADLNTLDRMVARFESTSELDLPDRLLQSLVAGEEAGGDRRGKQSAALLVRGNTSSAYVDLRVDDNVEPVTELARILSAIDAPTKASSRERAMTRSPGTPEQIRERQAGVRRSLSEQKQ